MARAVALIAGMLLTIGSVAAADSDKGNHPDGKFFKEAAQGGLAEVALGQLAVDKAESEAVKNFGQRMVTDHGNANQELQTLAASEGVTLPTDMGKEHKALLKKLSGMSGAEFDKAYMKEMIKDHKKDVSAFKKEAEQGKDEDVKNWAAKTLPTLQEHHTLAQTTQSQINMTGSAAGGSSSHGASHGDAQMGDADTKERMK
jgi:putative membrane protein